MDIRKYARTPRRGNGPSAQGNALGTDGIHLRPAGAKEFGGNVFFCPYRAMESQGVALDYVLLPLQGDGFSCSLPRALPWAMCCWPYRPYKLTLTLTL